MCMFPLRIKETTSKSTMQAKEITAQVVFSKRKKKSILLSDVATFNSTARDVSNASYWLDCGYVVHLKHCKLCTVLAKISNCNGKSGSPNEWTSPFLHSTQFKWEQSGHSCGKKPVILQEAPQAPRTRSVVMGLVC